MDINFEYYKIFYFVAKYRNITRAATALGSNQPNVTRVMKLLEAQLNCRLFIREARGISLTEEGELLYAHVEVAYRHLINAQEEIFRQDSQRCGTVEIGVTETALHLFLINALREFRQEYPAIKIKIHNQSTPESLKYLMSGKVSIAVITTPFDMPRELVSVNALDFQEILVGGTQYKDLSHNDLELADIIGYPWIGLGRESATYRFYQDFFITYGVDLKLDMEVATSDLMLPLIENNLGIGFVPETLALPLLRQKRLVQINLHSRLNIPSRAIQIVSDRRRGKSLAEDTFYKFLKSKVEISVK